jgi:hypothetical protein
MISRSLEGYSSNVTLQLRLATETLDVAQSGSETLILREPRVILEDHAELIVTIDGHSDSHPIMLTSNGGKASRKVCFW